MKLLDINQEYERIRELFSGVDEKQLELADGAIWECARLRIELNDLHKIIEESGLIKVHPKNPTMQKELPVSKLVVKARANYLNYIAKLSNILGKEIEEDDDELSDYE